MESSPVNETFTAFEDEFVKIAGERAEKVKRWARNTALIGAGYGLGQGVGMVADKGLEKALGTTWQNWSTPTKKKVIGTALGIATGGLLLSSQTLAQKRHEAQR
jgi:hypothetical protein